MVQRHRRDRKSNEQEEKSSMNEKPQWRIIGPWAEQIKKNMEKPIIRPVKIMSEHPERKVNCKNDKLITQEEVEQQIRANHPEQAKYWLGNGRGKHTEITFTINCPHCHSEKEIKLTKKADLRELLKMECAGCEAQEAAQNQHLNIPLPFGKFRGKTINFVMKKQPSYLAWFVDKVKGEDSLVEKIKTHTRFPQAWADYVDKQAVII